MPSKKHPDTPSPIKKKAETKVGPAPAPKARAAAKPAAKAAPKPLAKAAPAMPAPPIVAKPLTKLAPGSNVKPVAQPVAKLVAKPAAKPVAQPIAKLVAKPAAKLVAKPASAPVAKPAIASDPGLDEKAELPQRYGDDRMVMMARDPWWLFTYWDLSPERMAEGLAWAQGRPHEGVLRVYDEAGAWQDSPVHLDQLGHYVNIWAPGRQYVAEVGLRDQQGGFLPLLRSNFASAPPDQPSSDLGEEWVDIFGAAALWAASWGRGPQGLSSMDLALLASPSSPWGGASEHLASAWMAGSLASSWSSPGAAWGASPSSPWGAAAGQGQAGAAGPGRGRKFFLWSKTELILYGGTEPDAALTVSGKPVALRPDGTFTLRFALPDGDLDLEVKATSADQAETLGMTHQVKKGTRR